MKKLASILFCLSLFLTNSITIWGAEQTITDKDDPELKSAVIDTAIAPSYNISIPGDITINSGTTSSGPYYVQLAQMRVEPNKQIRIRLTHDHEMKMQHTLDPTIFLPYDCRLNSGVGQEMIFPGNSPVGGAYFFHLSIGKSEWDASTTKAGTYRGKITFTLFYEDEPA